MKHLTIAVDFDGTIIEDGHWPGVGPEIPGAIATLKEFQQRGHILILWTCRIGTALDNAVRYLTENDLHLAFINENDQTRIDFYGGDTRKISADLYIDDKAALIPGIDWRMIKRQVEEMERDIQDGWVKISTLPVGTRFYVRNGAWNGAIASIGGVKHVHVFETGKDHPINDPEEELNIEIIEREDDE